MLILKDASFALIGATAAVVGMTFGLRYFRYPKAETETSETMHNDTISTRDSNQEIRGEQEIRPKKVNKRWWV